MDCMLNAWCTGTSRSVNPLYMSYSKDYQGNFAGHHGYGYKSIETFIAMCNAINNGAADWCVSYDH